MWLLNVVDLNYFNWKLLFSKPYKTYQTHQTHPTVYISHHFTSFHIISHVEFDFFWPPEISPKHRVYPSLQGREAIVVVPGVHFGLRRQQHPADLRVAVARRRVQRGAAGVVLRGHGAGHRPQQVPDRAELAAEGRPDDVVVALGEPRAAPGGGSVEGPQRPQRRPKILYKN